MTEATLIGLLIVLFVLFVYFTGMFTGWKARAKYEKYLRPEEPKP